MIRLNGTRQTSFGSRTDASQSIVLSVLIPPIMFSTLMSPTTVWPYSFFYSPPSIPFAIRSKSGRKAGEVGENGKSTCDVNTGKELQKLLLKMTYEPDELLLLLRDDLCECVPQRLQTNVPVQFYSKNGKKKSSPTYRSIPLLALRSRATSSTSELSREHCVNSVLQQGRA